MIWLIGSKGMLGSEVARQLTQNKFEFTGTDKEVDITNPDALESYEKSIITSFYDLDKNIPEDKKKINWIINCSAYTNVDKLFGELIKTAAVCSFKAALIVPASRPKSSFVFTRTISPP